MPPSDQHKTARLPLVGSTASEVAALVAIVRRLSVARSLQEIMETVTHAARALLGADGITFVLRDGDLCHYAEEDAISPLWKGKRFPMSACISGWCMMEGKAAVIPDIRADSRIPQDAYRPTFVRSLAMVPVRQDDPMAAIGAYWAVTREIPAEKVELLQTVANSAALALAKVELEQERENAARVQRALSDRLKNMVSVVDAMSRQTLRSTRSLEEFGYAFSNRLNALGRGQIALGEHGMTGADVRSLLHSQLLRDGEDARILCDGPDVFLSAPEAYDLGMVLYELYTNACQYGALCSVGGRVRIAWEAHENGGGRMLHLTWTEDGGPRVTPPVVGGYGTALFQFVFKKDGGGITMRYEPAGVICTMRIPLP